MFFHSLFPKILALLLAVRGPPIADCLTSDMLENIGFEKEKEMREDLLKFQNDHRREFIASNMAELQWDSKLAAVAQKHALLCSNFHSDHKTVYGKRVEYDGGIVGENIWGGTNDKLNMQSVADVWFEEGKAHGCDKTGWECCQHDCSHFSQEVWAKTKKIGCGLAKCSMLDSWKAKGWKKSDDIFKYYQLFSIVCYYSPGGNTLHEKIFEPADKRNPWCSKCDGEAGKDYTCERNLCRYKN